jgi:hypothetical protein
VRAAATAATVKRGERARSLFLHTDTTNSSAPSANKQITAETSQ